MCALVRPRPWLKSPRFLCIADTFGSRGTTAGTDIGMSGFVGDTCVRHTHTQRGFRAGGRMHRVGITGCLGTGRAVSEPRERVLWQLTQAGAA